MSCPAGRRVAVEGGLLVRVFAIARVSVRSKASCSLAGRWPAATVWPALFRAQPSSRPVSQLAIMLS